MYAAGILSQSRVPSCNVRAVRMRGARGGVEGGARKRKVAKRERRNVRGSSEAAAELARKSRCGGQLFEAGYEVGEVVL